MLAQTTSSSTWSSPTIETTSATSTYVYYPMFVVTTSDTVTLSARDVPIAPPTEAEAAERTRLAREREEVRKAAQERAKHLLLEHLTDEQRATFERNGWFVVEGGRSKKQYRISANSYAGNVHELEGDRPIATYCGHVEHNYPVHDNALAQKLLLENDEDAFIKLANRRAA